jgi:hypothetical protein
MSSQKTDWLRTGFLICVFIMLSLPAVVNAGPAPDLDRWLSGELLPQLKKQLTSHPRFRGQPLGVAVMRGQQIIADPDQLAAGVQYRIVQALTGTAGIIMARQAVSPEWQQVGGPGRLDCRPGNGRYLVGVETESAGAARAHLKIRILDLGDSAWVPGFAYDWSGRLSDQERTRLSRTTAVETLRGQRTLPFQPDQPDLLAAHIAFTLGCGLLAQPEVGIRAWVDDASVDKNGDATLSLVGNYLASADVLRLTKDRAQADVILSSEIHTVAGQLKQYWASLRPMQSDSEMPSLEATAYVSAPGASPLVDIAPQSSVAVKKSPQSPGFVEGGAAAATRVSVLELPAACRPGRCDWVGETLDITAPLPVSESLVLEVTSAIQQRVFVLALGEGAGLTRLVPSACDGGNGVDVGPGKRLRHPLASDRYASRGLSVFVVTAPGGRASRRLAQLIGQVPAGCNSRTMRGERLERWLSRLDELMNSELRLASWNGLSLSFEDRTDPALIARR